MTASLVLLKPANALHAGDKRCPRRALVILRARRKWGSIVGQNPRGESGMSYVQVDQGLVTHRKTLRLARLLGESR